MTADRAKVERAEAVADEWNHREYVRMPEDFAATLRTALASAATPEPSEGEQP